MAEGKTNNKEREAKEVCRNGCHFLLSTTSEEGGAPKPSIQCVARNFSEYRFHKMSSENFSRRGINTRDAGSMIEQNRTRDENGKELQCFPVSI